MRQRLSYEARAEQPRPAGRHQLPLGSGVAATLRRPRSPNSRSTVFRRLHRHPSLQRPFTPGSAVAVKQPGGVGRRAFGNRDVCWQPPRAASAERLDRRHDLTLHDNRRYQGGEESRCRGDPPIARPLQPAADIAHANAAVAAVETIQQVTQAGPCCRAHDLSQVLAEGQGTVVADGRRQTRERALADQPCRCVHDLALDDSLAGLSLRMPSGAVTPRVRHDTAGSDHASGSGGAPPKREESGGDSEKQG